MTTLSVQSNELARTDFRCADERCVRRLQERRSPSDRNRGALESTSAKAAVANARASEKVADPVKQHKLQQRQRVTHGENSASVHCIAEGDQKRHGAGGRGTRA